MRLLIIDDSVYFVDAACRLLESEGITVVGAASNSVDALRRCDELQPEVALVDVDLGGESGFDLVERLHAVAPRVATILISTHGRADLADMIDACPGVGFIAKSRLSGSAISALVGGITESRER